MDSDKRSKYLGHLFGKDNRYEVVDQYRTENNVAMLKVKCHKCAKDTELFGDAIFKIHQSNFHKRGTIGCGCCKAPRWTEDQQRIRILRKCKEFSYHFNGFVGKYNGASTKLRLTCLKDGNTWNSTSLLHFFRGKGGCRTCHKETLCSFRRLPDEDSVRSFNATNKFAEGTKFTRVGQGAGSNTWIVECPVCASDEYSLAGVGSGTFTSLYGSLISGCRPCRCSGVYCWSEEQMQYRINKHITNNNLPYTFIGWVGEYVDTCSRVILHCEQHGNWDTKVSGFMLGYGCPSCSKTGFDQNKPATLYVLGITGAENFTGYGITCDYLKRSTTHRRNLAKYGLSIERSAALLFSDGRDALNVEGMIRRQFPMVAQKVIGFRTEATHASLYEDVVAYVESCKNSLQNSEECCRVTFSDLEVI